MRDGIEIEILQKICSLIIPFPYAWIASLVVGFCPWISTLRVIFRLLCFFTIFCVLATHVFCKMAASPPRHIFTHKRTVRLIIENDMRIDSLQVIALLPNFQPDITCVVPLFGGKCIDITLRDHKVTARLAVSGFDYGDIQKLLRLLGKRAIHVPWFVRAEFPENVVVNLLKQYRELKTQNVRRLYF